jgi:hypothetical protein
MMGFSKQRVDAHIQAAIAEVLAEIEKRARTVLRNNPAIDSFCMGMGRATFYRKDGEPIMDELSCMRPLFALIEEYDDDLRLTGTPMKIDGPDEPVITDW